MGLPNAVTALILHQDHELDGVNRLSLFGVHEDDNVLSLALRNLSIERELR